MSSDIPKNWMDAMDPKSLLRPEDTLKYYENGEFDPTDSLSESERAKIVEWTIAGENTSVEPNEIVLSWWDKFCKDRLNAKADLVPDDFTEEPTILDKLSKWWNEDVYPSLMGWDKVR